MPITAGQLRQAINVKNESLRGMNLPQRHDDIVVFLYQGAVPKGLKSGSSFGSKSRTIRRIDAETWLQRPNNPKPATMNVAAKPIRERIKAMPNAPVELSERASKAMDHLFDHGPSTAKDVAEAISPGSDARGAAQTLRRLTSDPAYVSRTEGGCYKLSKSGRARVAKMRKGSDAPDSTKSPAVD